MTCEHHRKQHQRWKDRKLAAKVLGRDLEWPERVHHHTDGTLIICEDQAYHFLLHRRTDALKACGHVGWRRCVYCGEYSPLEDLYTWPNNRLFCHKECNNKRSLKYYHLRRDNDWRE